MYSQIQDGEREYFQPLSQSKLISPHIPAVLRERKLNLQFHCPWTSTTALLGRKPNLHWQNLFFFKGYFLQTHPTNNLQFSRDTSSRHQKKKQITQLPFCIGLELSNLAAFKWEPLRILLGAWEEALGIGVTPPPLRSVEEREHRGGCTNRESQWEVREKNYSELAS